MAVAATVLITCDRVVRGKPCGEPAKTYTVTRYDNETWDVDLCNDHAFWDQVVAEGRAHKDAGARRTASRDVRPWTPGRKAQNPQP